MVFFRSRKKDIFDSDVRTWRFQHICWYNVRDIQIELKKILPLLFDKKVDGLFEVITDSILRFFYSSLRGNCDVCSVYCANRFLVLNSESQ